MKMKRTLCLLLSLIMIVGMLPTVAMAAECEVHEYGNYSFNADSKTYEAVCTACGNVKTAENVLGKLPGDLIAELYEAGVSLDQVYEVDGSGFDEMAEQPGDEAVYSIVEDPDSLLGAARKIDGSQLDPAVASASQWFSVGKNDTFQVGIPNGPASKSYLSLSYAELNANLGAYTLYKFANVTPTAGESHPWNAIHLHNSWSMQNPSACAAYKTELTNEDGTPKSVDMYLNMKVVGDTAEMPVYYIDRIIFVDKSVTGGTLCPTASFTISWDVDGDGDVDDTTTVEEGEIPVHADGARPSTTCPSYRFTGWSPALTAANGDVTYTAQFMQQDHNYGYFTYNEAANAYETVCQNCGEKHTAEHIMGRLPESFLLELYNAGISLDHVYETDASGFTHASGDPIVYQEEDPASLLGVTTVIDPSLLVSNVPAHIGVAEGGFLAFAVPVSAAGKKDANIPYAALNARPGEYQMFKVTDVKPTVAANGVEGNNFDYIHLDPNWIMQNRAACYAFVDELTDENGNAKTVDAYINIKVDGNTAGDFKYSIDRIIFVDKAAQGGALYFPTTYTISWDEDGDGVVDATETLAAGVTPIHADGYKAPNEEGRDYIFTGWEPAVGPANGDVTYTAQFELSSHIYGGYTFNSVTQKYEKACTCGCGDVIVNDHILGRLPKGLLNDLYNAGISLDHVYDHPGEGWFDAYGETAVESLVEDPDSLLGVAKVFDSSESSRPADYLAYNCYFHSYVYDASGESVYTQIKADYGIMTAEPRDYVLYKFENINPTSQKFIAATNSWVIQNYDVPSRYAAELTNANGKGKTADMYISMKVIGDPEVGPVQYWFDRVILVDKEAKGGSLYEPPTLVIGFDANGGEGSMQEWTLKESGTITLPDCNFINETAVFAGWQIGTEVYQPGETVDVDTDTTVVALWDADALIYAALDLANGDFEDGEEGSVPADWTSYSETDTEVIAVDETGNQSLHMVKTDEYDLDYGAYSTKMEVEAGATYYVEAKVKGEGSLMLYAQEYVAESDDYASDLIEIEVPVTADWSEFAATFTVGEDYGAIDLMFNIGSGMVGDLYIDDVAVYKFNHALVLKRLNEAIDAGDAEAFAKWVGHELSIIKSVRESLIGKYLTALAASGIEGDMTGKQIQKIIDQPVQSL